MRISSRPSRLDFADCTCTFAEADEAAKFSDEAHHRLRKWASGNRFGEIDQSGCTVADRPLVENDPASPILHGPAPKGTHSAQILLYRFRFGVKLGQRYTYCLGYTRRTRTWCLVASVVRDGFCGITLRHESFPHRLESMERSQSRPKKITAQSELPGNRNLGSIFNRDIDGLLYAGSGEKTNAAEYTRMLGALLQAEPGVLAMNVGMPDPVTYRSRVATSWDTYITDVVNAVWPGSLKEGQEDHSAAALKQLLAEGTDCLRLAIEACRERGVLIVASYRMNAEDFYRGTNDLSDFGRTHAAAVIPEANCLDPARPEVFAHRIAIFAEMAQEYDIDGIEFDFRRWTHMVSTPLENHPVLTDMVRKTRAMLNEAAAAKARERLLLGVRVGPSLADPPGAGFPGGKADNDLSCRDLGLDVPTWIGEELVDYMCPSLFWPRLPGFPKVAEFRELAGDADVGIYPTVFPLPAWAEDRANPVPDGIQVRRWHRDEILRTALECYRDGADGISTYNWGTYFPPGTVAQPPHGCSGSYGRACEGYQKVLMAAHPPLRSPDAIRRHLEAEPDDRCL